MFFLAFIRSNRGGFLVLVFRIHSIVGVVVSLHFLFCCECFFFVAAGGSKIEEIIIIFCFILSLRLFYS
jgi:hypothetical protein